ncbi:MAG: hypothetical protein KC535_04470, partial [Nanoarchaeota archaeon]|nr:hypothetical protein [Nanoarchaeota archaeon]
MSKDFDLEPPQAPTEKKAKKNLFGKLFSKKSSSLPELPLPQDSDISALRDKLGITSAKVTAKEHFDLLEQEANATADEDAKKYDQEQSQAPPEGSLDDALMEMSKDE